MIDRILSATALVAAMAMTAACSQDDETYVEPLVLDIKREIFIDHAPVVHTAGGRMATLVNSREQLEEYMPTMAGSNTTLMSIDFSSSTLVYDQDTIIYERSSMPDALTTYVARGRSGNYSFSYYIETMKPDGATDNDKRHFIIGAVVDKLPDDAQVYVDKNLNYIDSTVHLYPKSIGNMARKQ